MKDHGLADMAMAMATATRMGMGMTLVARAMTAMLIDRKILWENFGIGS